MEIKSHFDHFNINVTNLEKSLEFYGKALGLKEARRQQSEDGSFVLVFISDGVSPFRIELTWLRDHPSAYELGENESHICFRVEGDYEVVRKYHKENGWVCYENEKMGIYFIHDPDNYWIEIIPMNRE
jgi:lactoylglutathione lyase